jgi:protein tyrosine phosphatase (PTP) superfamily phosphohydrolase (DUF442 family)
MSKTYLWRAMLLGTIGAIITVPVLSVAAPAPQETAKTAEAPKADAHGHSAINTNPGPLEALSIGDIKNVLKWNEHVYSGSCPYGDLGFKSLAEKGIKTIITVDGAKPDLKLAHKYGMRYVHIPIEYSGIARQDALKIIRAVRDLPGPVFIHCHHGLHRGPAATALALIATDDDFDNKKAVASIKQAGTGANYKGLWSVVGEFQKPTKEEIDAADNTFPEATEAAPMAQAMVNIDNRWEHLRDAKTIGWKVSEKHPDIEPAHEALLLEEAYHELNRSPQIRTYPADFIRMMNEAEKAASDLQKALRAKDDKAAVIAFDAVKNSCSDCHKLYRDNHDNG